MLTFILLGRTTLSPVATVYLGPWRYTDEGQQIELHTFGWNAYYGHIANDHFPPRERG